VALFRSLIVGPTPSAVAVVSMFRCRPYPDISCRSSQARPNLWNPGQVTALRCAGVARLW
jgi:hypothetical protein